MPTLDDQLAAFWAEADDDRPAEAEAALEALLAPLADGDPVALFERASLHDFLGEEAAAIPLYRAALDAGLSAPRRTRAMIQLASSLRNVGEPSAAMAVLRAVDHDDELWLAAQAFLALALLDDDKPAPALRTALQALAPALPAYRRAVEAYADAAKAVRRIRTVAVALLVRDGWVLAEEYAATPAHDRFLRLPGGGVEFGETADAAVRREVAEELDAVVEDARLVTVSENIFPGGRAPGHEIVFVFAVRSAPLEALARDARLAVRDSDTTVGWYRIADLRSDGLPLYPDGALALAEAADRSDGPGTPV
jgi:ADP-ribose pyrophosphatase YjhB (NUDIX family)